MTTLNIDSSRVIQQGLLNYSPKQLLRSGNDSDDAKNIKQTQARRKSSCKNFIWREKSLMLLMIAKENGYCAATAASGVSQS